MSYPFLSFSSTLFLLIASTAFSHDVTGGAAHPASDREFGSPVFYLAQATAEQKRVSSAGPPPSQARIFLAFTPQVSVRWDERTLFVESHGLPTHGMMVGITTWQQQVPLPQRYLGTNAWQIPRVPVPAREPLSIKGRFLRGAIALAANGIPIFNPQNNRGELSAEIGELDEWGGHCGRADDYHYHAAPLHLQSVVGPGQPIAYALDGYPIHGLLEPDGSTPSGLDAFNGHTTAALGYHYHASKKYPYVQGGFHGEVTERDGQVDPQPRATPIRGALPPLRGAKITGFTVVSEEKSYALQYWLNGKEAAVKYAQRGDTGWDFQFVGTDGVSREETYRTGGRPGAGGARPGGPPAGADSASRDQAPPENASAAPAHVSSEFLLGSPVVTDRGALPVEYTGDGAGATPPLAWSGAPAGTKSFALIMHHLDREGKTKYYWTLYDIPASVTHLDRNSRGVGTLGTSFKGQVGYEPPHSQGPGAKTYVLTLYALSAAPPIASSPSPFTGDSLAAAIKNVVLASTDLRVVYESGQAGAGERKAPPRNGRSAEFPPAEGAR